MNRKDLREGKSKTKISNADLRRKEKDLRKLQQELTQEKEKFNQTIANYLKTIHDLNVNFFFVFV